MTLGHERGWRALLRGIFDWQEVGTACSGVDSIGLSKIAPLPALFASVASATSDHGLIGNAKAVEERRATNLDR